jgi:hypothetical protein
MQGFRARRTVLECEPLEGRDCPAVITFGGSLLVLGTAGADKVDITDDGTGNLTVTVNGTTQTATNIKAVTVLTFGGNDTITYTLSGDETGVRVVAVDAGAGDDTVTLNAGNINGHFAFVANGGAGADTLSATIGGVAVNAAALVALAGGPGADTITANASGKYDGYFALALSGGSENDTITGTVNVAAGSTGQVVALQAGGFGDDNLTLNVTGDGLTGLKSLVAIQDGGPGTDTGVATDNVTKISIES